MRKMLKAAAPLAKEQFEEIDALHKERVLFEGAGWSSASVRSPCNHSRSLDHVPHKTLNARRATMTSSLVAIAITATFPFDTTRSPVPCAFFSASSRQSVCMMPTLANEYFDAPHKEMVLLEGAGRFGVLTTAGVVW